MVDDNDATKPLDPTTRADDLMGDTSGRTGVTVNKTQDEPAEGTGSVANTNAGIPSTTQDQKDAGVRSESGAMVRKSEDVASEVEKDTPLPATDDNTPLSPRTTGHPGDLVAEGNETQEDAVSETTSTEATNTQEKDLGEQDPIGGTAPATGTQGGVGDMTKQVGFDYDSDKNGDGYENDPVNIAKQIDEAEKAHRES